MRCKGENSDFRFSRKAFTANERRLYTSYWKEYIKLYGTYVDYYTYDYSLTAHDFFYGEHTLAPFSGPNGILMMAQFTNDSLLLSKFGIQTDADATFIVSIQSFREIFKSNIAEPKSGDLIRLTEIGSDRPGGLNDENIVNEFSDDCGNYTSPLRKLCNDGIVGPFTCKTDSQTFSSYNDTETFKKLLRGAPVFEITERRDENLASQYNFLFGHYVWIIQAKRYDYSYQPKSPTEPGNDQVCDDTKYGLLSSDGSAEVSKKYDQNIDDASKNIFDYSKHPTSNTDIYGEY